MYAIMPISPAAASGTRYPHDVTASAKSDKPTESGGYYSNHYYIHINNGIFTLFDDPCTAY